MQNQNTLQERLRSARASAGYSVETAARMLDVKPKTVSAWESGRSRPDDGELLLLAKLYSVELSFFTEGSGAAEAQAGGSASAPPPHTDQSASDTPRDRSKRSERSECNASPSAVLADYLEDGEEVLWEGRPAPRWKYAKKFAARVLSALAPIPFFFLLMAADEIDPRALPFIITVFIVYLGYLEGVPLAMQIRVRYAVTSRRVLILLPTQCIEYRYESNDYPRLYLERNGYGSIFFRSADLRSAREANREIDETESYGEVFVNRHRRKGWRMPATPTKNLVGIENAEELYRLISHRFDCAHPLDRESKPADEENDS